MFQPRRRSSLVAILCVLCAAIVHQPSPVAAQAAATGQPIEIYAAGGLLGFIDGFPEYVGRPGEELPKPVGIPSARLGQERDPKGPFEYGGLFGLTRHLGSRSPESLLLLTANNHPQRLHHRRTTASASWRPEAAKDWFWSQVAALRPQAIALGTEDVHRFLAQMRPEVFVQWLTNAIDDSACNGASCLPFLATNAVIKYTGEDLNIVEDVKTGIRLEIPETESVGWINKLQLAHPCDPFSTLATGKFSFVESDAPKIAISGNGNAVFASDAQKGDVCHTTLALSERLRPGRIYTLRAPEVTSAGFTFRITTHAALTPHKGPGPWNGLPVIRLDRGAVPIAIMSFVTPEVAGELPPSFAEWSAEQGCQAEACRIEVLPAAETAAAMLDLWAQPNTPIPLILTMTDLLEEETDTLLDAVPETRVVVLQPESLRMGRGARAIDASKRAARDKRNYSGDIAFVGVVDPDTSVATRVMARPEWIGEVIARASMQVAWSEKEEAWALTGVQARAEGVYGAALKPVTSGHLMRYTGTYHETVPAVVVDPDEYRRYCELRPDGPFERSARMQGKLWTDRADMLGLLLDTMRETSRADVALVPASWVDNDVIRWLASKQPPLPEKAETVDWLSGFILQRALFRVERTVTVSLDAAAAGTLLQKIVSASAEIGDPLCASGIGDVACPLTKLDTADLMLNRRRPQAGHFYKLALPAGLAREHKLTFDEEKTVDLLKPLDDRLAGCIPGPARQQEGSLRARLELDRSGRIQRYIKLDPLSFELAGTSVSEPEGAAGLFAKLPLESSSAKDNRLYTVDVTADIVPLDTRRWAVRIPAFVEFTRKELEGVRSYDRDEYNLGLRGDYKRWIKSIARVFAGGFIEGDLRDRRESVTATRTLAEVVDPLRPGEVLTDVTVSGPKLTFLTRRQRFVYLSTGGELSKLERSWGAISDIRISADYGRAYNLPTAVIIGDRERSLEDFRRLGPGGVLKSVYQEDVDGINASTDFGFRYTNKQRLRSQLDGKVEIKTGKAKLSISNRVRYYKQLKDEPLLVTRWAWKSTYSWDIPIIERWSIAPYYELNLVQAKGVDGAFRISQGGVKIKWATFFKTGHGFVFE